MAKQHNIKPETHNTKGLFGRWKGLCRRFIADPRGVTAIEFALIAMPLMILLFGIIETSLIFLTSVVVDGAVYDGARMIRTGEAQQSDDPVVAFSDGLCDSLFGVVDCDDVAFDVRTFEDFSSIEFVPMYDEETGELIPVAFDAGGAGDIVVVRVSYQWEILTPFLAPVYGNDYWTITSTAVFRTEPYEGII